MSADCISNSRGEVETLLLEILMKIFKTMTSPPPKIFDKFRI